MRLRLWGTRGSIAVAGPDTVRYGGDTSAVELECVDNRAVILDGGSGIRAIPITCETTERVDILLSHLHMDHVQGLPFFPPSARPRARSPCVGAGLDDEEPAGAALQISLSPTVPYPGARSGERLVPRRGPGHLPNWVTSHHRRSDFPPGVDRRVSDRRGGLVTRLHPRSRAGAGEPGIPRIGGVDLRLRPRLRSATSSSTTPSTRMRPTTNRIGWGHTSVSQLATYAEPARRRTLGHVPSRPVGRRRRPRCPPRGLWPTGSTAPGWSPG